MSRYLTGFSWKNSIELLGISGINRINDLNAFETLIRVSLTTTWYNLDVFNLQTGISVNSLQSQDYLTSVSVGQLQSQDYLIGISVNYKFMTISYKMPLSLLELALVM